MTDLFTEQVERVRVVKSLFWIEQLGTTEHKYNERYN